MMDKNNVWDLVGAFTGVVFVVLVAIGVGIAGETSVEPTDPSSEAAKAFIDKSDNTELGVMISLVGLLFFFPFLSLYQFHNKPLSCLLRP